MPCNLAHMLCNPSLAHNPDKVLPQQDHTQRVTQLLFVVQHVLSHG
jgi:hypothetical protein